MELPNFLGFLRKCHWCREFGKPGHYTGIWKGKITEDGSFRKSKVQYAWRCDDCQAKVDKAVKESFDSLVKSGRLQIRPKQ
jgi:hypothetical protein